MYLLHPHFQGCSLDLALCEDSSCAPTVYCDLTKPHFFSVRKPRMWVFVTLRKVNFYSQARTLGKELCWCFCFLSHATDSCINFNFKEASISGGCGSKEPLMNQCLTFYGLWVILLFSMYAYFPKAKLCFMTLLFSLNLILVLTKNRFFFHICYANEHYHI